MPVLRLALDVPLHRLFDYLADAAGQAEIGLRVRVPFGRGEKIGVVVEVAETSDWPLEQLKPALEILRDRHDRTHLAIILIGMPGVDQRFRHYPQLYSRLGFSHRYRNLGRDELIFVLDRHWRRLGRTLDPDDFTDAHAIATIERITRWARTLEGKNLVLVPVSAARGFRNPSTTGSLR